jgi:hypothetical protein
MTKSPIAVAKVALRAAKTGLDSYPSQYSRYDYTQQQLFAILVLRQFLKTDYPLKSSSQPRMAKR